MHEAIQDAINRETQLKYIKQLQAEVERWKKWSEEKGRILQDAVNIVVQRIEKTENEAELLRVKVKELEFAGWVDLFPMVEYQRRHRKWALKMTKAHRQTLHDLIKGPLQAAGDKCRKLEENMANYVEKAETDKKKLIEALVNLCDYIEPAASLVEPYTEARAVLEQVNRRENGIG